MVTQAEFIEARDEMLEEIKTWNVGAYGARFTLATLEEKLFGRSDMFDPERYEN